MRLRHDERNVPFTALRYVPNERIRKPMLISFIIAAARRRKRSFSWSPSLDLTDPQVRCALFPSTLS